MPAADSGVSWRWVGGIWGTLILLSAWASYANAREADNPISLLRALWLGVGAWLIWALLTPVIVRLGQRWPLDRRKHWRFVLGHLAGAAAVGVVATAVTAIAVYSPGAVNTFAEHVRSRIVFRAPMGSMLYFLILGVSYLVINTRRLQEKELFAERLSRELTEAQLEALRIQLQPHFLFNGLNAVMALVRDQATDRADRALTLLSEVLRTTLREGTRLSVPLREEVAFIRNYLEIEMLRFGDRLGVVYSIPDDLGGARVPIFILQPLVENALQHGLRDLPDGGRLQIGAERRDGTLVLTVVDDGVGLPPDWQNRARGAVGITNVQKRLAHMYGDAGSLTIMSPADRAGVCARVELPFEDRA